MISTMTRSMTSPVISHKTRHIPIREEPASYREPTLAEILSDSIVEAIMRADAVDPAQLSAMLRDVARARRAYCFRARKESA